MSVINRAWYQAQILPEDYYVKVHNASLKILQETGVVFHSEEALKICKAHGAKVNGKVVCFSESMVEAALEKCPKKFLWHGRDPACTVTVGEGLLIQPNVGPVYIEDTDRGRRLATIDDYANIIKLCHSSKEVQLNGSIPVDPCDVPQEKKHLFIMYNILKNTTKPVIGSCTDGETVRKMLQMMAIAMGLPGYDLQQTPYMGVLVNPLSPLSFSQETLESIIEYSKAKQVIMFAPCIMAGVSGPINLLGTAVLQNTEILAAITLLQLVNPGTPVVYATASTVGYMKNASFAAGAPEAMLTNMPNLQMAKEFYKLPTRTMTGITHAKTLDCQAGYETMMSLMLGMMSGANIFVQSLGVLDAIMTTSYEKFIIDEELISRIRRLQQGIEISEDALSTEIIQEIGQEKSYLMHQSTFNGFRSLWRPTAADWESYEDWKNAGAKDVVSKANTLYKQRLEEAPETMLDRDIDQALQAFLS